MLNTKLNKLFSNYNKICIGFSGGVDSSLLLYLASQVKPVVAITVDGPMVPRKDLEEAKAFASSLNNVKHIVLPIDVFSIEGFKENSLERCYYCKKTIFTTLKELALKENCDVVFDGANIDDLGDFRPGMKAIEELEVLSPFLIAGLTKSDIYNLSKKFDLPTKNKPSAACLASRIPTNDEITLEKLNKIEKVEEFLKDLGFKQIRARLINDEEILIECLREEFGIFRNNVGSIKKFTNNLNLNLNEEPKEYKQGSMNKIDAR